MRSGWRGLAFAIALVAMAGLGVAGSAQAETATLRVTRPLDLTSLPLLVMEHEHLVERTAEAMGLGAITVTWSAPAAGSAAATNALVAGQTDLVTVDLVPFLLAVEASAGTPMELRGVGSIAQRPYVLVSRNNAVRTITDLSAADRIAVPDTKTSGPAVMLEMAAAQEWGGEHYNKLDSLMVARSDEAAAAALSSPKPDITAHFSRTPFADVELADQNIHRVINTFDIAGPHSAAILATTGRFRTANPQLCGAILSALQAADDFIKKSPGAAAEIFSAMVKDQDIPLEDLTDMIGDPDLAYTAAPVGAMRIADFMVKIGRLKRRPAKWQEWFLPEARDLPGS